jgi:hypothetical protein
MDDPSRSAVRGEIDRSARRQVPEIRLRPDRGATDSQIAL